MIIETTFESIFLDFKIQLNSQTTILSFTLSVNSTLYLKVMQCNIHTVVVEAQEKIIFNLNQLIILTDDTVHF